MVKKWIISAGVAIAGLLLLAFAAKLCGELDAYHIAQPGPHGQLAGTDRELLFWLFLVLLGGVSLLAVLVSAVAAGLKWKTILFRNVACPNLLYWTLCSPIVACILCVPSWVLLHIIPEYMRYLR